jgi:hypothetical protein
MTRDELIDRTKRLIAEGDGLLASGSLAEMRAWLQRSDELLGTAWGSMDRYHLAWLMVGKPKGTVRGRAMTPDEEAAYVREVAAQKTSALRMSLDAVERQGMPFLGEEGGLGPGQGGPGAGRDGSDGSATADGAATADGGVPRASRALDADLPPEAADLAARIREARERAAREPGPGAPRAPRPEKMQR